MVDMRSIADGLEERADGYWVSTDDEAVSYPALGHQRCLAIEDSSFWFGHRASCITTAVRRFPPTGMVFDIGGGNGHVSQALNRAGFASAVVEPGIDGANAAYERGIRPVVRATTHSARFDQATLGAVGLFDVLEHIKDDKAFFEEIATLMIPGGRVYVTVPAYEWLWSADDERAGHYRRYTEKRLRDVVEGAGFRTEYATYIFRFLPLPVALARSLPSRLGRRTVDSDAQSDHNKPSGAAGSLLSSALAREQKNVAQGRRMRFGGSILLIARLTT